MYQNNAYNAQGQMDAGYPSYVLCVLAEQQRFWSTTHLTGIRAECLDETSVP